MWLSIISIIMTVLLSGYLLLKTHQKKESLAGMSGMMIAMSTGMMSSLALGFQLGIVLNRDLQVSSIIAILFGLGAGYFTGKPISVLASLEGMLAGIMGGMMGAMLGSMLGFSYLMTLFVDVLFIFVFCVVVQLFKANQIKNDQPAQSGSSGISAVFIAGVVTIALGTVSVGLLLFDQFQDHRVSAASSEHIEQHTVQKKGDVHVISVDVASDGFSQPNIVVKASVPTQLNFVKHTGYTCIRNVQSADAGFDIYLEKGDNVVTLKDLKPGTYHFNCGMYMYYGTITVV